MALSINQISYGIGLNVDNEIYQVVDYTHVKPGKGAAFVRVKLKNIKNDTVLERTFRTADKLDEVSLEEGRLQYLYRADHLFHFMDQTSYEEVVLPETELGEATKFLLDNLDVTGIFYKHKLLKIVMPNFISAQITDTEPGFKGDSTRAGTKPASIQTGATIQVPLFINKGEWVKIDTRTGTYVERVQK